MICLVHIFLCPVFISLTERLQLSKIRIKLHGDYRNLMAAALVLFKR
jgi:hypothetical protein